MASDDYVPDLDNTPVVPGPDGEDALERKIRQGIIDQVIPQLAALEERLADKLTSDLKMIADQFKSASPSATIEESSRKPDPWERLADRAVPFLELLTQRWMGGGQPGSQQFETKLANMASQQQQISSTLLEPMFNQWQGGFNQALQFLSMMGRISPDERAAIGDNLQAANKVISPVRPSTEVNGTDSTEAIRQDLSRNL